MGTIRQADREAYLKKLDHEAAIVRYEQRRALIGARFDDMLRSINRYRRARPMFTNTVLPLAEALGDPPAKESEQ